MNCRLMVLKVMTRRFGYPLFRSVRQADAISIAKFSTRSSTFTVICARRLCVILFRGVSLDWQLKLDGPVNPSARFWQPPVFCLESHGIRSHLRCLRPIKVSEFETPAENPRSQYSLIGRFSVFVAPYGFCVRSYLSSLGRSECNSLTSQ